ncbi:hypothetical protein FB107DRAFT_208329 [Schizophyllum commune]
MSDHSDKYQHDQPISELVRTGRRVSGDRSQPPLQHVPPRHRSGASSGSNVRRIDGYLADDSGIEEHTADGAIVEAGDRAANDEAAGHRNGDVAVEGGPGDDDDFAIENEHSDSTRSDSDTSAHGSFGETVDIDELDSEEYVDDRTRYHHTDIWDVAQGLFYRVFRDRDGRQEVEFLPHYSLIKQREAGGFPSAAAYPLTGDREASPSSSVDEHDRGDEDRVHHPPQVDLQLEQVSWTSTSAPMSSTGTASQHEPSPASIRPSIPNLLNDEDMEVPRPWGPSAGIADQLVASATASPRGANQHIDTGATSLTATDATGQGAQTPAGISAPYSIRNRSPILLGPGSRVSIRLSVRSPTPTTEPALPPEDLAGAAEHGAPDLFSHGFVPASPEEAALLLELQAGNAWSSPGTNTELLPPDTNQGDVLSPDATSATLTGGTINIGLPEIDPSASTESARVPAPVLHDSTDLTQCGQQGQRPRRPSAHPPSPRPPSRTSMPSSAPHQESPISPPSPTSDNDGYSDIWAAKLHAVWEVVNGQLERDEDVRSGLSSAEHAANPPSTTRTAVAPPSEGSDEKKNRKRASKRKKTALIDNAREAYARAIEQGGPALLDVIRKADRVEGQPYLQDRPRNPHAGTQECLDENTGHVLNGISTSRAIEGAAREQSLGNLLGAANEDQLEFEFQEDIEQGDMPRCTHFILYVVHRSRDETVEQAIARGRLEIRDPVQRLFFDSWNRAIATDRNNPPAADSHGQSRSYASTQPARGPMNPVYPAQTRVIVFVACEDAYTFTVAELGDDESPLRAPEGTQGNKKKGAKKGSKKKGSKKGGQQDQDPVEMLPRRTFTRPEAVPVDYGNWNPPTRAFIEARALEAEGVPEDLPEEPAENGVVAQDNASDSEGANVNGRRDEGRDDGCGAGDSQLGQSSEPHDKGKRSKAKERKSEDEDEDERKKNARPPPELRSRREILDAHSDWSPIRYDDRRLGQDLRQILADIHHIMLLSYPPLEPMPGTHSIVNNLAENAREQNADNDVQGRVTRSKGKKRQRAEDEDEEANDAGPSRPAKKRKGKAAPTTSSQRAPAAPSQQPPAPRGNKRRRDEATEDAAPAPKRTRRGEEPDGSANPRPSARASTSQAPRLIAPASLVQVWPSLEHAKRAAADEQRLRESMSRPSASAPRPAASLSRSRAPVPRQPPRPPTYRPPPGPPVAGPSRPPVAGPWRPPVAGPSRQPIAGPSRPNRKRRLGDETDDDEDDEDYVDEGGPVTWESGRRAKKPKRR